MAKHKYRTSKIKREHHIIEGVYKILLKISEIELVVSIIPGRISQVRGVVSKTEIRFTTETEKGFKCIAQSKRAVQEIFIVTEEIEKVINYAYKNDLILLESRRKNSK